MFVPLALATQAAEVANEPQRGENKHYSKDQLCALVDLLGAVALATPGPVLDRIVHSVRMLARAQRPPHCHVKPFPVGATRCKKGLFVACLAFS